MAIESLEDLDALLLADSDRLDALLGVDREVERPRELPHTLARGAVVKQEPRLRRLGCEDYVLGHGHHWNQHEMLVHHADAATDRVLRRVQANGLALDQDLALVGLVEPVENVHQGRLAGAVLPQERVNLAAPQVEVDGVVGHDSREALRDPPQFEDDRAVVSHGR